MKTDINELKDVHLLVDDFYGRVRKNELIGPIFDDTIKNRWPEHLEKMYCFWQTVLLGEHTYFGSPFPPHAYLLVDKSHFDVWLTLFQATIEEHFEGETADRALMQANRMALVFQSKIEYIQTNQI